ncbi:MAG: AAA family ATPase [Candidatus Cloacimonetes bacterium]|jgi:energy-coupling factor transporter ATP-binding protein EcfA2|nr:AAA family ATPase [Candidatus Cloacimonadota bacterium]MDY0326197.1 AAA family ATPase [Candidatus Cloacimonadaceae bacterium]
MTIEYLWIEKYKCLEKQGFNFGGENLFSLDFSQYSTNIVTITSKKNKSYIQGFYNLPAVDPLAHDQVAHITNVTALVGENGSGKTTVFDFIKGYFPDGEGEIDTNCLFVNRDKDGAFTLFVYNEHDIRIEDRTGLDLKIIPRKHGTSSRTTVVGTKPFRDVNIIFFSNIFDQRFESEVIGLKNISTNYLVRNEKIKLNENKTPQAQYLSDVQAYHNSEIEKQLRFVSFYHKKNNLTLPFSLPDKLVIERANEPALNEVTAEIINKYKELTFPDNEAFTSLIGILRKNIEMKIRFNKKSPNYEIVIIPLVSYLLIHNLYCILHYGINFVKPKLAKLSFDLESYEPSYESLQKIIVTLGSMFEAFRYHFDNIGKLLKHFIGAFEAQHIEYWDLTNRYVYNINHKSILGLSQFLELYFGTQIIEGALNFNWSGLSSGQLALFNMYSRLHYLVDSTYVSHIDKDDILLLLDEPDVYLHPEWQKRFIESIIKFIAIDYASDSKNSDSKNQRRIQIVFSTNNPLTLSDILPTNVVKLCRHSDGRDSDIIDCYKEGGNSTFGANLYNLLNDAFFFDNDYIGSFAKLKIEEILKIIHEIENSNGLKIDNAMMNDVHTLISAIGEPIIKSFLTKQLEDAIHSYKGDNDFLDQLHK